jgi:hypothetical protein
MNRTQLEHILRSSIELTGSDQLVVVGSQAILGQFPDAPPDLLRSIEADIFSLRDPSDSEEIDGAIGEASQFHREFGYYAHGVGEETATLPVGWKERLIAVRITRVTGEPTRGFCLEAHDLAVSKLAAGREKDIAYVRILLNSSLISPRTLRSRIFSLADAPQRDRCLQRLLRISASAR